MEQIKLTTNEAIFYTFVIHAAIGFLLGLIPLVLGFIKKERSYAAFGFLGSIVGGLILGLLLSVPVAAIFTWLILRKSRTQHSSTEVSSASDSDVS